MNSFMSWIGGKKSSRDIIIPRFPMYYEKYVEVFGGGGWILFAKPPNNDFEVFNDANSNIQILFQKVIDILNRILYNIDTGRNLISYLNRNLEEDNILLKKYRFCFDIFGLVFFLIIMIPNFIWFTIPAPNDILRNESVTAIVDMIGSICQVLFISFLCIIQNKERNKLRFSLFIIFSIICIIIYFVGWVLYYNGITDPLVILLLTFPPCLAFIFFALDRKNIIAVVPAVCFTICHLIYGIVNYIL